MTGHYKITAIIVRAGCMPVKWLRYSPEQMTRAECEKMLVQPEVKGMRLPVRPENFRCVSVNKRFSISAE
ncbi:hypothetical protein EAQG_04503 [Escherichia coli TA464]|uniref:DUF1187 family protein n=1 Tax=Escherichia coli TaxID=562 RepID=UPI000A189246|nr:DUF1187 family protein [Escherichia coli]OSL29854.1 hypothetical protein EAQG_04503 [Escherichia coli TA464]